MGGAAVEHTANFLDKITAKNCKKNPLGLNVLYMTLLFQYQEDWVFIAFFQQIYIFISPLKHEYITYDDSDDLQTTVILI